MKLWWNLCVRVRFWETHFIPLRVAVANVLLCSEAVVDLGFEEVLVELLDVETELWLGDLLFGRLRLKEGRESGFTSCETVGDLPCVEDAQVSLTQIGCNLWLTEIEGVLFVLLDLPHVPRLETELAAQLQFAEGTVLIESCWELILVC